MKIRIVTHTFLYIAITAIGYSLLGCGKDKHRQPVSTQAENHKTGINKELQGQLAKFSTAPRPSGRFAFAVYDLTADTAVYGYKQHEALPSASCLKLLTGVAGLHLLGTDYVYRTRVFTRGSIHGDTLRGDIIFAGSLDPQFQPSDLKVFTKAIRHKGIRHITGKLIINLAVSQPVQSESHWYPWDLSFSHYGLFYKGATRIFREVQSAFNAQGYRFSKDRIVAGYALRTDNCVMELRRPISVVIQRMWKNSSNTQATALLYTIGRKVNAKQHPTVAGVNYLRQFMTDSIGIRDSSIVIHDGCGLCTHNHLSPVALTSILRYAYTRPELRAMLFRHLAIAGVDGTLRVEMGTPDLRGCVWGKTGTLSHPYGISSLAGLCRNTDGHILAFSIMNSEMSVLDARVLQRKLCRILIGKKDNTKS